MIPAVFLDRDGVLNKCEVHDGKPYAPRSAADFVLYPETLQCLETLKRHHFLLFVVTNQPDVGNGITNEREVHLMHDYLKSLSYIDHIAVCFHSQAEDCGCRKPGIGMFTQILSQYNIDIAKSYMVGDRATDITAGNTIGLKTIFIDRQYTETISTFFWAECKNLKEATNLIINDRC